MRDTLTDMERHLFTAFMVHSYVTSTKELRPDEYTPEKMEELMGEAAELALGFLVYASIGIRKKSKTCTMDGGRAFLESVAAELPICTRRDKE